MFNIVDNITIPASSNTRNRARGDFATAIDKLEVGQGFIYQSEGTLKAQYPRVAPKKFSGRKYKLWAVEGAEGTHGVARLADKVDAAAADATEDASAE